MNFRSLPLCVSISCLLALPGVNVSSAHAAAGGARPSAETEMVEGALAFQKGAFEDAVAHWQRASGLYQQAKASAGQIDAAIHLAAARQSLGQTSQIGRASCRERV